MLPIQALRILKIFYIFASELLTSRRHAGQTLTTETMSANKHLNIIAILLVCMLAATVTSCGSGRHSVSRGSYRNDDIYYASEKSRPVSAEKKKENTGSHTPRYGADMSPVVAEAFSWLGTKYRYGGHSKSGTDCSGLVWEIYRSVMNVKLPRSSWEQQQYCKAVSASSLLPGDLVFFSMKKSGKVSHVGIYVGEGEMIHASESRGVIKSALSEAYYKRYYHSSGRVLKALDGTSPAEMPRRTLHSGITIEDLDNAVTEKTDSILSSFMD